MSSALSSLTPVGISNLLTKGIARKSDPRQNIPPSYQMPDEPTRKLLVQLMLEEFLETAKAFGFSLSEGIDGKPILVPCHPPSLWEAIDGCCDLQYVAAGAMIGCGAPDGIHLKEVCRANNAKFPRGEAIIDPQTGKYLKPLGWSPPDHELVASFVTQRHTDLSALSDTLVANRKEEA